MPDAISRVPVDKGLSDSEVEGAWELCNGEGGAYMQGNEWCVIR